MKQKIINFTIVLLLVMVMMVPAMVFIQTNVNAPQAVACLSGSQGGGGDC